MLRVGRGKAFNKVLRVPGDKSISHRAVMLGAIADGTTRIENFLPGDDCHHTIECFQRLGVKIEREGATTLTVHGKGWKGLREPDQCLDVGNSGTTIRLLLGILAGSPFFSTVYGDASIARRPMARVVEPLRRMGARIDGRAGGRFAPLAVRGGELKGIEYHSPVASAQVKSCLLLAGLRAEGWTKVKEPHPSRDHTERMLKAFGAELSLGEGAVSVRGGQSLAGCHVRVPGDISSAAFLFAAALLVPGSRVTVRDVGINPTRTGILDVFRSMGAEVTVTPTDQWCGEPVGDVTVAGGPLRGVEVGGDLIPRLIDEIPVLAVVATQAEGRTVIRDAAELKVKESNRIATVAEELRKMGAQVDETSDGLIIEGPTSLQGALLDSHGDHRIGMAMAVAGLASEGEVRVKGAEAISVSFPNFAEILKELE
ncbi:3-phosphoshikimate 1-carboxyvinyltransferase [Planifilum fimeticola]|jgi:3-phosphoshikimate 1-carboxyvinyltransferase|uniref:3-phosphoshikimate 1-carboxyvinyltransferase n=1 Tax=Planifilum fimeticola TaxID=201975 RepID=A0A2T0LDE1_9BACL|nr:3-phosphoshikimate 1-carboxyvinyltransferase [Planifilum fimeticola]PRX40065.1 3-phosphoshikimate 1-carboxyvinyltransferase [Planifilum fimeticola]